MSKFYTVNLPVKPYIRKYVQTVEGPHIPFKGTSMLCKIVRAYLQNKNATGLSALQTKSALALRTSSLQIVVPIAKMHTIGIAVSDDGILQINAFLQDHFERAVYYFMRDYTRSAEGRYKGYKEGVEAFARMYNICLEDDFTFDGLKKLEYRFRKKEESIISKIVLSLS